MFTNLYQVETQLAIMLMEVTTRSNNKMTASKRRMLQNAAACHFDRCLDLLMTQPEEKV
jgi:hypothetical protein